MKIKPLKLKEKNKEQFSEDWLRLKIAENAVDLSKKIDLPDDVLTIGTHTFADKTYGTSVMTIGEISVISAPSKTMKSKLKGAFVAAILNGEIDNFRNFKGFSKGKDVFDIDTEQGEFYAQNTFKNSLKLTGKERFKNYKTFALRKQSVDDRVAFIDAYLQSNHKDIRVVFIDGISDLLNDANDLVKSNELVEKLQTWSAKHKIHICVILHNAWGLKKPTGHLGSAITKKAESVIFVSRNEETDILEVECGYSRGVPFEKFEIDIDKNGLINEISNDYQNKPINNNPF